MSLHWKPGAPLRNPRRRAGGEPSKKQKKNKRGEREGGERKIMSLYHLGKEGSSPCIIIAWLALDGVGSHFVVCII